MKNSKNTKMNPVISNPKQTRFGQNKSILVENHEMINNLTSIHFDYHLNIIILSKWVLVLNQNLVIKNHYNHVIDVNKH